MTSSLATSEAAAVADIAGRSVALRYTSIESEYAALHRSAILVDRSHRARMTFEGDNRAETLTGLVTNDIGALTAGSGLYAAALTPRGKIITDVRVFARESDLLIDVPVRAAAGWVAMIRKYVNPRTTRYADHSESLADLGVFGARARSIVGAAVGVSGETLGALAPYSHVVGTLNGNSVLVARVPDIGVEGYEVIVPVESRLQLWRRALELGGRPGRTGHVGNRAHRSRAPRMGNRHRRDDDPPGSESRRNARHLIHEGMLHGPETVARVHFRGHVNRHLRGLTYPGVDPLPQSAQLFADGDKPVGDVRSTAVSPRLGGVAIAMVRREITPGTVVRARWEGGESSAVVLELPFPVDVS